MADQRKPITIGDRVRIVRRDHPWFEHYGRVSEEATFPGFDWVVELELGGIGGPHRAGCRASDLVPAGGRP